MIYLVSYKLIGLPNRWLNSLWTRMGCHSFSSWGSDGKWRWFPFHGTAKIKRTCTWIILSNTRRWFIRCPLNNYVDINLHTGRVCRATCMIDEKSNWSLPPVWYEVETNRCSRAEGQNESSLLLCIGVWLIVSTSPMAWKLKVETHFTASRERTENLACAKCGTPTTPRQLARWIDHLFNVAFLLHKCSWKFGFLFLF